MVLVGEWVGGAGLRGGVERGELGAGEGGVGVSLDGSGGGVDGVVVAMGGGCIFWWVGL